MSGFTHRVVVKNAKQTMDSLGKFQPDAAKEIRKSINKSINVVRDDARGMMPSGQAFSGWGAWSQGGRDLSYRNAAKGIRVTKASARARGEAVSNYIGLVNSTPGGSIFELAGRRNSADASFMAAFASKGYGSSTKGNPSRGGVFKAFDQNRGKAVAEIEGALKDAERRLQTYLDNVIGE